jgi:hypothetical protein
MIGFPLVSAMSLSIYAAYTFVIEPKFAETVTDKDDDEAFILITPFASFPDA